MELAARLILQQQQFARLLQQRHQRCLCHEDLLYSMKTTLMGTHAIFMVVHACSFRICTLGFLCCSSPFHARQTAGP